MKRSFRHGQSILYSAYTVGFIFFLHSYLPVYFNSSFLSGLLNEKSVGFLYTVAYLFSILALLFAPLMLKRFGNYKFALALLLSQVLVFWGLSSLSNPASLIILFILSQIGLILIGYSFDIFVEQGSINKITGGVRGIFLTIGNFALVLSPFIAGLIVGNNNYQRLFAIVGVILLPAIFIAIFRFRGFKDSEYRVPPLKGAIERVWGDKNMRSVFIAQLMLRIFYAFMAIYLPIYMHEHIGFSWPEIGVIFTIMVLPFALFELPLGKLADKRYGEKEMLVLGFVITGVSTMFLSMDFGLSIALWALILFITRVGVSMIEIMSQTYFFKKINAEDSEIISLFRMIGPASYALVPIIVLLLFFVIDLRFMFVALGLLFIYTIRHISKLEDTK